MTSTEDLRDYHEINDEANKAIIQQLADDSGDTDINEVVLCYEIGSSDREIRKQLSRLLVTQLKKAATYLGCNTDGGPNQPKMLKDDIISYIITRVESLLMDMCGICDTYFNNLLTDQPKFSCLICRQGCHKPCFEEITKVFEEMPPKMKQTFEFICTSCSSDFKKDSSTAQSSNKKFPVKSPNKQNQVEEDRDEVSSAETHEILIVVEPEVQTP